MAMDNACNCGKTDASALEVCSPVEPLEGTEELVRVPHVETDAVVADETDPPAVLIDGSELYPCISIIPRELVSIAQQILDENSYQVRIAGNLYPFGNGKPHRTSPFSFPEVLENTADERGEVHGPDPHVRP
ncbi:MAG: hypothetical protein A4E61_00209 [Syntrophorhabdus sp. PtaB.Bin184]|nr:MAG: hypothetical protein A4E61_00209 [Syntrophorhabdus sp. PtaB.Bin184]